MRVAIHQPQFLPWLGYLHKIASCDAFVFLDNVQFKKNEFQNRNKLLVSGEPRWVTVPVSFRFGDTLRQARVPAEAGWRDTMWKTLEHNYGHAPFFGTFAPGLRALIERPWACLADFNEATVRWLLDAFGIATPLYTASRLPEVTTDPTGRLVALCRLLGADTYLSGAGGHDYLDTAAFEAAGLRLAFQEFHHPVYPQTAARRNGPAFVSHLSAFDGLMNCGGGEAGRRALGLNPTAPGA
jgi:hypothetical protein